jgi:hypothetical protein
MDKAQIASAPDRDESHRQQQHGDTEWIGRHTVQGFRRDDCAERYADQHKYRAHHQCWNQHRPAGQRGAGDCQNGTRQPAGRHTDQP